MMGQGPFTRPVRTAYRRTRSNEYGPAPVEESVIRRLVLIGVLLALLLFACRLQESEDGADDSAAIAVVVRPE